MFLLLGARYPNHRHRNQCPSEGRRQPIPPYRLDTSKPNIAIRLRLYLGPDRPADARHHRHGEVLHSHQQAARSALVTPRHAAGDEDGCGREAHVGPKCGEGDARHRECPVAGLLGLWEEEDRAEAEGDHTGGEDHVGGYDVQGLGDYVRGEEANEAVWEEVQGCGQR